MPGFQVTGWMGVLAPKGTPEPIVASLDKEFSAVLALPEIKSLFAEKGAMNIPATGREHFRKFIRSETGTWRKVVRTANIQAQ